MKPQFPQIQHLLNIKNLSTSLDCPTTVILAGGMGSRLRQVIHDLANVMAPVKGMPFLTYIREQISRFGFQKVVLSPGVFAESVSSFFGSHDQSMGLNYSHESDSRGTGGALRQARGHLFDYPVLVMNGDSFCDVAIEQLMRWPLKKAGFVSIALARVDRANRFWAIQFDTSHRVVECSEKGKQMGSTWINAGLYRVQRAFVESNSVHHSSSLEEDIFSQWIPRGNFGYPGEGRFLDIRTPPFYRMAEAVVSFPDMVDTMSTLAGAQG